MREQRCRWLISLPNIALCLRRGGRIESWHLTPDSVLITTAIQSGRRRQGSTENVCAVRTSVIQSIEWAAESSDCHTLGRLYSVLTPVRSFVGDVTELGLSCQLNESSLSSSAFGHSSLFQRCVLKDWHCLVVKD